jgi:hypothetical protein
LTGRLAAGVLTLGERHERARRHRRPATRAHSRLPSPQQGAGRAAMFDWFWNMLSALGFGSKEARILILGALPPALRSEAWAARQRLC